MERIRESIGVGGTPRQRMMPRHGTTGRGGYATVASAWEHSENEHHCAVATDQAVCSRLAVSGIEQSPPLKNCLMRQRRVNHIGPMSFLSFMPLQDDGR